MNEIDKLVRTFEVGITRRGGIRCDAVMCTEVVELLRKLKELKESNGYGNVKC